MYKNLEDEDNENEIMRNLVLSMLSEIRDELSYISYFKQLVTQIDFHRMGKSISAYDLEHEFSTSCNQRAKHRYVKGKKKRASSVCASNELVKHSTLTINVEARKIGEIDSRKINAQGDLENITLRRSHILNEIFIALDKKENHDLLIDSLIDLEENFVQH